jgi:hypothetical protein
MTSWHLCSSNTHLLHLAEFSCSQLLLRAALLLVEKVHFGGLSRINSGSSSLVSDSIDEKLSPSSDDTLAGVESASVAIGVS